MSDLLLFTIGLALGTYGFGGLIVLAMSIVTVLDLNLFDSPGDRQAAARMLRGRFLIWPLILVSVLRERLREIDHESEHQP